MHKTLTEWMYRLFMHLDRGVVVDLGLPTVSTRSLLSFKDLVYPSMRPILMGPLLAFVDEMRGRETVPHHCALVKECIEVRNELCIALVLVASEFNSCH